MVVMTASTWLSMTPVAGYDEATAREAYQADHDAWVEQTAYWNEHKDELIAECEAEVEKANRADGGAVVLLPCDEPPEEPKEEFYLWAPPTWSGSVTQTAGEIAPFLVGLLAMLLGALLVGSEFTTGAIGTWLTFEPRRDLVYATKVGAAGLVAVPTYAVVLGYGTLMPWVLLRIHDLPAAMPAGFWTSYWELVAHGMIVVVGAAMVGAALGFLLRHPAIIFGVGLLYFIAVEQIAANMVAWVARRSVMNNVVAFVNGEATYYTSVCKTTAEEGFTCEPIAQTLDRAPASLELAIIALVCLIAGWLVFRRRDVS
jgi:ABC-2 type transport system permease protein